MIKKLASIILISFTLSSCNKATSSEEYPMGWEERQEKEMGKLTGEEGIVLFGGKVKGSGKATDSINVNSYLWRASLDTVHFMPLISADPFGGTIITDWYKMQENSQERYKINIYIIGAELRSDAIKVAAFKQVLDNKGNWGEAQNNPDLAQRIEDKIILKAREVKFKSGR